MSTNVSLKSIHSISLRKSSSSISFSFVVHYENTYLSWTKIKCVLTREDLHFKPINILFRFHHRKFCLITSYVHAFERRKKSWSQASQWCRYDIDIWTSEAEWTDRSADRKIVCTFFFSTDELMKTMAFFFVLIVQYLPKINCTILYSDIIFTPNYRRSLFDIDKYIWYRHIYK